MECATNQFSDSESLSDEDPRGVNRDIGETRLTSSSTISTTVVVENLKRLAAAKEVSGSKRCHFL